MKDVNQGPAVSEANPPTEPDAREVAHVEVTPVSTAPPMRTPAPATATIRPEDTTPAPVSAKAAVPSSLAPPDTLP